MLDIINRTLNTYLVAVEDQAELNRLGEDYDEDSRRHGTAFHEMGFELGFSKEELKEGREDIMKALRVIQAYKILKFIADKTKAKSLTNLFMAA